MLLYTKDQGVGGFLGGGPVFNFFQFVLSVSAFMSKHSFTLIVNR